MRRCIFVVFFLFISFKLLVWSPYFGFIYLPTYQAFFKAAFTILYFSPFSMPNGSPSIRKFDLEYIIVDSPNSQGIRDLLKNYPPPNYEEMKKLPFRKKVLTLRKFASKLLPEKSSLPQSPEPCCACVLLGQNEFGQKYPNLCSKAAKIFVQYLWMFDIPSRIVQLQKHISVEVWNRHENRWELQDPYFDSSARDGEVRLSAVQAHYYLRKGMDFTYTGPKSVFKTVVQVPISLLSVDLPKIHYFNYENLSFWKVRRVSADSDEIWK